MSLPLYLRGRRGASLILGMGLLTLSFAPGSTALDAPGPARGDAGSTRPWVQGYHTRTAPVDRLLEALEGARGTDTPVTLNALVHESMAHGPSPRLLLTDNWLAWLLGALWSDARTTQDPVRLAGKGVGLCSDTVIVLGELANAAGFEFAMVDLQGHVVGQSKSAFGSWILDPSYGVCVEGGIRQFVGAAEDGTLEEILRGQGHDEQTVQAYLKIARRAETGAVTRPMGVLSPRLARVESTLAALSWVLPLALIFMALLPRVSLRS